ncbi:toxin-antitoxin system TumE family protein [Acetobacter sp. AAB5]|uniref:toxin-antitoxin system TumE family protein n=1 Tax=Acetobacter sp. AAB5 TaxID=3418370 RepID=UPI003CEC8047
MHHYKYCLALISDGKCILRYDNESGKGGHQHIGVVEFSYIFQDLQTLKDNFLEDVREWLK